MTEPDVALTDYALTLECAVLALWVFRAQWTDEPVQRSWGALFVAIGVSAVAGGTVHGFFLAPGTVHDVLWTLTLLALGVVSLLMWWIGARLGLAPVVGQWVRLAALAQLVVYAAVVLFISSEFEVAIVAYAPATLFLLATMILAYRRVPDRRLAWGITGLLLTFVAAGVQQSGFALHPVYFNHNAFYHLIQGVALYLLYLGAVATAGQPAAS